MKAETFVKPFIPFDSIPDIIALWIKKRYEKVQTKKDMADFVNHCLDEAEKSVNPVRGEWYQRVGSIAYACLTQRSYESNINILINYRNNEII